MDTKNNKHQNPYEGLTLPPDFDKLSKNKQKQVLKQLRKEQKKKDAPQKSQQKKKVDEELDPSKYYDNRVVQIKKLKEDKEYFPYPHKFEVTHSVEQAIDTFSDKYTENSKFGDEQIAIAGRIHSMRKAGKNLVFIDLISDAKKIQVLINRQEYNDDKDLDTNLHNIKRGDVIGVNGVIGRSKTGELSVLTKRVKLLSPCLHVLPKPDKKHTEVLTDQETRYRQRYLDLMVNQKARQIFITRSKVIAILRQELAKRNFLEVETPILNMIAGGATARPFKTYHNELDLNMSLRVAPELFLKNCVVGGLNRVFEIGKNFRNEGIDMTHNPEFTSCELYWAYADYKDLMTMTEQILCKIVMEIKGSYKFTIKDDNDKDLEVDFTPPFKRVSVIEELEKKLNKKFPRNFETQEANKFFDDLCNELNVGCSTPRTTARLIDKLIAEYLEVDCLSPTFLMEQPQVMCPLAKYHRSKEGLTERFEMFINRKEFINAYTELNDPFVQLEEFQKQVEKKKLGDLEANDVDDDYVKCLEHGLPPTAGWGLGIDRLIMLLTNSQNIQEVILFPAMKPKEHKNEDVQCDNEKKE